MALLVLLVAVLVAVFAAPADASVFGPRAAHSPNAEDIRTAYWVGLILATLLFVAINAALVLAVIRFRAGRGRVAQRVASGPGALLRPAVPLAVIAVALFIFGIVVTSKARQVKPTTTGGLGAQSSLVAQAGGLTVPPDAKQLDISVIGQRWLWRFEYPGGRPGDRVFSYDELVVPVNTAVILHLTSTDILHRWFVPALGGQVDAIPGQDSITWFRADRTGVYPGASTQFSGTGYPAMRTWVKVVSPSEYQAFVKQKKTDLAKAQATIQKAVQQNAVPGAPAP